jgi:aspartate ammonia-lyase
MSRTEQDFLGQREIADDIYYGVQTIRGKENFHITGIPMNQEPYFVKALGYVKKAAAMANRDLGAVDTKVAEAIIVGCDRVIAGDMMDQFVTDFIQGGAGTSTNMNANEVIANLALEKLGHEKGRYDILHPNDHVNASQSTNDVYPTAVRLALWTGIDGLLASMAVLRKGFEAKADEFKNVLKIGRTQLQDAVPMTLGQEFSTYAVMIEEDEARLREARALIQEINLGATAIGTGINAPAGYADMACKYLAEESGIPVVKAHNLVEATQDTGAFVQLSGVLKRVATKLSKTCNDLRLLSSGPQAGFGDIKLPPRQAGSSIMPGKVNPVIPEVMNQVAFEVIGNDVTVTMASEAGQLQLNAFEPIMGWSLFKSITHLSNACRTLNANCVLGIEANHELLARRVRESITLVTALNPIIGYEKAALIAKTAMASGQPIDEVAQALGILTREQIDALLVPEKLTQPLRLLEGAAGTKPAGR